MESLFEWMAGLGTTEGIKYFSILAVILLVIPYSDYLLSYLKLIIFKKEFVIHFFEYSVDQNVYAGKDKLGNDIFIDLPNDDILLIGSKIKVYWKVEGALKIDIHPIGKGLKGNCAEILIDPKITNYTLTAYGIWGKKLSAEILIPTEKLYKLDTTKISSTSIHLIRPVPVIEIVKLTKESILTNTYSKGMIKKMNHWFRTYLFKPNTSKIKLDNLVHASSNRKKLYKNIDDARLIKGYTFSTKKYQTNNLSNQTNN